MIGNNTYGCLMALSKEPYNTNLINFAKKIIPESILYIDPKDPSFGYSTESHVTIKYGFDPDLNNSIVEKSKYRISPFNILLTGLTKFSTPKYDVIKFNVTSPVLQTIRDRVSNYKNYDQYPEYHPHLTLAYVKPNTFTLTRTNLQLSIPIVSLKYSGKDNTVFVVNL